MLQATYRSAAEVDAGAAEVFIPPQRVRPSEAAARFLRTEKGPWEPALVPYCMEPLDLLAGRDYQGIVFVGPARTGKTMGLILGGVTYVVTCAPGDILVVQMSQDAARDFSRMDLDRAIRHSPELSSRMSARARDDNTFDKFFRSGVALKLGWPAVSQLSAKTLQYVFLTDYDRPENVHNVDGEGPMWGLAFKRIQTYMSRGKCVAESSPGEEQADANWLPRTPHEAPPCRGILSIYNAGTRARWYWPCQHRECGQHFEAKPGLECFAMPDFDELVDAVRTHDLMSLAAEFARVVCPHCGGLHDPEQRSDLNRPNRKGNRVRGATWLHGGEQIVDGRIEGERRRSQIASYWLGGVAAAYQTWPSIVHEYLQAVQTYARTGDEGPLRRTTNTDQGAPYLPRAMRRKRSAEDLVERQETWPKGAIPDGVRFLTAAVDVQMSRFVVTVYGWGPWLESWIIARFSITASERPEGDRFAGVDPAAYAEDWRVLIGQVMDHVYKTSEGFEMKPRLTVCDSGGREGVTDKAYEFCRYLKRKRRHKRFKLVKGTGNLNAPRTQETWPDSRKRKDRAAGRGDVPVWLLNVNVLKDGIWGDLGREEPGPGYCHLPDWLDEEFFDEIVAETRTAKGWIRDAHTANEAFDLHAYNRAACIILRAEAINWQQPPEWALPVERRIELAREREEAAEKRPEQTRPMPRRRWVTNWK